MALSGDHNKIQVSTVKRLPPNAGKGRKKGVPNKTTRTLREALLASFETLGGEAWLVSLAESDPKAYAGLLGRLIPSEVSGHVQTIGTNPIVHLHISDDPTIPEPALTGRFGDL